MRLLTFAATFLFMFTGLVSAQTFDPKSQSPLTLLQVPGDGVAYYQAREQVSTFLKSNNHAAAEPLAERIVREYPRDGANWIMLAQVKEGLKKYSEAAAAYLKAGPILGWGPFEIPGWNAAANYVAAGNRAAAIAEIRRELFERHSIFRLKPYNWPEFAALKDDAEFRELTTNVDLSKLSRNDGWMHDVEFLYDEIKRVNPDYRDAPFPAEFERRYAELKSGIPKLSDEEIYVGMQRMLAVLRQGHLVLFVVPQARYLPLVMYAFPDGIHVVDAGEGHKHLIGAKVLSFGKTPAEETWRRWAETQSVDGDMQYTWGPILLASTFYLKGLGAIDRTDTVTMTLQTSNGATSSVKLGTMENMPPRKLMPPPRVTAPLFLRNVQEPHWELALPQHDALYIQMNNVHNEPNETLEQFGLRIRKLLADTRPRNLILDLRHNNGGSTLFYREFLRTMVAYTAVEGNQLYVVTGRGTYSAAGNLITDLERLADPIFVGEAAGECCALYGDPSTVILPYSKIFGEVTGVRWNLSVNVFDARKEISPEVPIQLTAKQYFAGEDPALEAIYKLISLRRSR